MTNPPDINKLLARIGLVENGEPLAEVRDFGQQGTFYDLLLHTDPETAAEMVEKQLGLKAVYSHEDGSQYWAFTLPNEWSFYFESYRSGSTYMSITDLRQAPKPVVNPNLPSLVDISNSYQELKKGFKREEKKLAAQFNEVFESNMVEMLKQVEPIKAVVWVQYAGMEDDFTVQLPHFLSFVPTELREYYDNIDLPTENDFIIDPTQVQSTTHLNDQQRKICLEMKKIITNNDPFFLSAFGDHKALCLTTNGLEIKHYEHS